MPRARLIRSDGTGPQLHGSNYRLTLRFQVAAGLIDKLKRGDPVELSTESTGGGSSRVDQSQLNLAAPSDAPCLLSGGLPARLSLSLSLSLSLLTASSGDGARPPGGSVYESVLI